MPFECKEWAPINTVVASLTSDGRADSNPYVQGIGGSVEVKDDSSRLPSKRGRESITMTENRFPSLWADNMICSTRDDLRRFVSIKRGSRHILRTSHMSELHHRP